MSKSTGSKGSDNNSKGSNTSSSSGSDSDSDSKGSSSASKGGGNSGSSKASDAAAKSAADAKAKSDAAAKASAESASKAQSDADAASAKSQGETQHQAAVDAANKEQTKSAETYGSFIQGVLDAAPVGVDNLNKGRFGTDLTDAEINNTLSEADHAFAANKAWNAGEYGNWASEKIGGMVDSVQGWGLRQTRELTQAPLDKIADMSRDPAVKGIATLVGGLPGLALTTGIGVADSIADYAQGEKTGKQSTFQGIGDVVMGFGPPQARLAYSAVTNPREAAKTVLGGMTGGITDPIASVAMNRMVSFGVDNMAEAMSGTGAPSQLSGAAMGESLLASRGNADNSYQNRITQTTGSYTKPIVMGEDAMMLELKKMVQQEQNKPRYSSSLLFGLS